MNAMGNQSKVYGIEFCSSKDINLNIKSITEGCVENPKFDVTAGDDKTIPLLKPITIDKIYAKETKARQSERPNNGDTESKKRFSTPTYHQNVLSAWSLLRHGFHQPKVRTE